MKQIFSVFFSMVFAVSLAFAGSLPSPKVVKVNDRISLYNQKPMGTGDADREVSRMRQRYDMGTDMAAVAQKTTNVTDRRQAIRIDQPIATSTPTRTAPAITMSQVAAMVQNMIGDLEPRFAARIYRQLEQSLYA